MRRALRIVVAVTLSATGVSATALSATGFGATASAQSAPLIIAPGGAQPARRWQYAPGRLVDCAEHGVWTAPEGWTRSAVDRIVIAIAPDGSAAIARAAARPQLRDDATFLAQVAALVTRIAGSAPTLDPIQTVDVNRWRRLRTVLGTVRRANVTLRVIGRSTRTGAIWVGLHRDGDAAARAAIDASIDGWQMLTSHACACGTDCDHR